MISGFMQAGGADVGIEVMNGQWTIISRASPGQVRPHVTANCYPLSSFRGLIPPGQWDTARWLSGPITHQLTRSTCPTFVAGVYAWWGDAATFLTRILGGMYGTGEQVLINQNTDPRQPSLIAARTCQGTITMNARSLFIGDPGIAKRAVFKGPGGVGDANIVGEYAIDRNLVTMARTDEAFCYFTLIQGAFAGFGERAEIVPDSFGEYWQLRTLSQQGALRARARCFMLDQN
jgi:hypothetical protein